MLNFNTKWLLWKWLWLHFKSSIDTFPQHFSLHLNCQRLASPNSHSCGSNHVQFGTSNCHTACCCNLAPSPSAQTFQRKPSESSFSWFAPDYRELPAWLARVLIEIFQPASVRSPIKSSKACFYRALFHRVIPYNVAVIVWTENEVKIIFIRHLGGFTWEALRLFSAAMESSVRFDFCHKLYYRISSDVLDCVMIKKSVCIISSFKQVFI